MKKRYTIKRTSEITVVALNDEEAYDTAADVYGVVCDYEIVSVDDLGPEEKESK